MNTRPDAMAQRSCPDCSTDVPRGEQTCPRCGEPLPYEPGEPEVPCRVCGAGIAAYAETCPQCGERGYPALRPRKGGHFQGAPEPDGGPGDGGGTT